MPGVYRMSVANAVYLVAFSAVWFALVAFTLVSEAARSPLPTGIRLAGTLGAFALALLPAFPTALMPFSVTLTEDGTCEFRSLLRRQRVRVHQIRSIDWDDEGDITIRYDRGTIAIVADRAFEDLLIQLFQANPAIHADDGVRETLRI